MLAALASPPPPAPFYCAPPNVRCWRAYSCPCRRRDFARSPPARGPAPSAACLFFSFAWTSCTYGSLRPRLLHAQALASAPSAPRPPGGPTEPATVLPAGRFPRPRRAAAYAAALRRAFSALPPRAPASPSPPPAWPQIVAALCSTPARHLASLSPVRGRGPLALRPSVGSSSSRTSCQCPALLRCRCAWSVLGVLCLPSAPLRVVVSASCPPQASRPPRALAAQPPLAAALPSAQRPSIGLALARQSLCSFSFWRCASPPTSRPQRRAASAFSAPSRLTGLALRGLGPG